MYPVVACVMIFTMISTNIFASEIHFMDHENFGEQNLEEYSKKMETQEIYDSLSDEAKVIFNRDLNALIYQEKTGIRYRSVASLAALNLPAPVLYTLQAMMSGFVAAAADGPLPFGDAVLAVTTVAAAGTIAIYWDEVAPKWDEIVNVFKTKFGNAITTINKVFSKLKSDVNSEKKELDKVKSKIPDKLKDKNGNVDLDKFKKRVKNKKGQIGYQEETTGSGWTIEKDRAGQNSHGGSAWKLKTKKQWENANKERTATLDKNGKILRK